MTFRESVFVDTSAWVALVDRSDDFHTKAVSVYPSLLKSCRHLVTSNLVLAEAYVLIMSELGQRAALDFLKGVKGSPRVLLLYSDEKIESEAEKILMKYEDHPFSYADAVSFAMMKAEKVKQAFCFDKHFLIAGFAKIP